MSRPALLEHLFLRLADALTAHGPAPRPTTDRLRSCRIISHRGEHDNRKIIENTLPAFEKAARGGAWGLELDIRWTLDHEPVVFHDPDLYRLFGSRRKVASLPYRELKQRFPSIASLAEVVACFGGRHHLMIEIKAHPPAGANLRLERLTEVLRPLQAVQDYHLLALEPSILRAFPSLPALACVAVSDAWPGRHSQWVGQHHWGGVCGHYLLVSTAMVHRHQKSGQCVGTGYVRSRNVLFREINRGIDWIFSNHAVSLRKIAATALSARSIRHEPP